MSEIFFSLPIIERKRFGKIMSITYIWHLNINWHFPANKLWRERRRRMARFTSRQSSLNFSYAFEINTKAAWLRTLTNICHHFLLCLGTMKKDEYYIYRERERMRWEGIAKLEEYEGSEERERMRRKIKLSK